MQARKQTSWQVEPQKRDALPVLAREGLVQQPNHQAWPILTYLHLRFPPYQSLGGAILDPKERSSVARYSSEGLSGQEELQSEPLDAAGGAAEEVMAVAYCDSS